MTIAVVLVFFWLLGFMSGYTENYFIHILLFFAFIAILVKIEDDCSDYDSGRMMEIYLKRHLSSRVRRILPKTAILSGEKVSQSIFSPHN
jgi:hypothetical protein